MKISDSLGGKNVENDAKNLSLMAVCGSVLIQGVLILQDQYRALLQYSFSKESDGQYDKLPTDWYCNCGVFNFKRRDNCFKCSASREESEKGGEGSDEISNILTKSESLANKTLQINLIKLFIAS